MTVRGIKRRLVRVMNGIVAFFRKIGELPYYVRRSYLRRIIKPRDFTVISNNCWAGKLYQYLNMQYLSPTVGLYFFSEDYLKFVKNLRYYLEQTITFISVDESRYKDILIARKHDTVPLGRLGDVEIVFLHYKTQEEARTKWNRRKMRVNYDNLYFKFSNMNLCTEDCLREFANLPYENKFILNNRRKRVYSCEIYWNGEASGDEIILDTKPFPGIVPIGKIFK